MANIKARIFNAINLYTVIGGFLLNYFITRALDLMFASSINPWVANGIGITVALAVIIYGQFRINYKIHLENLVDDIKFDLLEIYNFEKNTATEKAKQVFSKGLATKVREAFKNYFGTDMESFNKQKQKEVVQEKNIESLVGLYSSVGNILDYVGNGLKRDLISNEYRVWSDDVDHKWQAIKNNNKKKEVIRKNCELIRSLSYGIGSAIIIRQIIRNLPVSDNTAAQKIGIYIEGLERDGDSLINQMVGKIDENIYVQNVSPNLEIVNIGGIKI